MNWTDQTANTVQKSRMHVFKFLVPQTPFVEKIVNLRGFKRFRNQEISRYYLFSVDHNGMAAHHTRSECERF